MASRSKYKTPAAWSANSPHAAAIKDLARSGIAESTIDDGHFEVLDEKATRDETRRFTATSHKIVYYDRHRRRTGFFRLRFTSEPRLDKTFGKPATSGRPTQEQSDILAGKLRYWQPTNLRPQAYFPPLIDWNVYFKVGGLVYDEEHFRKLIEIRKKLRLALTEGEKKSYIATARGIPTIGIGGIWNFRTGKAGLRLLPELEDIDWPNLKVTELAFDSDVNDRTDLLGALAVLTRELHARGARVQRVVIPRLSDDPDVKTGLDDLLLARGAPGFEGCERKPCEFDAVHELNAEWVYVRSVSGVMRRANDEIYSVFNFSNNVRNREAWGLNAAGKPIRLSAGDEWLDWRHRAEVETVEFMPRCMGEERHQRDQYNLWRGWPDPPAKMDAEKAEAAVDVFYRLLAHLLGYDARLIEYLLDWLAYIVQHPEDKVPAAIILYGAVNGSGKTLLGKLIQLLFGAYGKEIKGRDLIAHFNKWAQKAKFVLVNEVQLEDKRSGSDLIKTLFSDQTVNINVKYGPQYDVTNVMMFLVTTNDPVPVYVDATDRRLALFECCADKSLDETQLKPGDDVKRTALQGRSRDEQRRKRAAWAANSRLASDGWEIVNGRDPEVTANFIVRMLDYLLERKVRRDIFSEPPMTEAKALAKEASAGDKVAWLKNVSANWSEACDFTTVPQLVARWNNSFPRDSTNVTAMTHACRKAEIKPPAAAKWDNGTEGRIETKHGWTRLRVMRNFAEEWAHADATAVRAHYDKTVSDLRAPDAVDDVRATIPGNISR